jgi:hypothetical protein
MALKYALFEFIDDANNDGNGMAVGLSSWIVDLDCEYWDNEKYDFDEEVEVNILAGFHV